MKGNNHHFNAGADDAFASNLTDFSAPPTTIGRIERIDDQHLHDLTSNSDLLNCLALSWIGIRGHFYQK